MDKCEHPEFVADVDVNRLSHEDGGPITHYDADIRIRCKECGMDFEFVGAAYGMSPYHPAMSIDAKELHVPIVPEGGEVPRNLPGYGISFHPGRESVDEPIPGLEGKPQ